jgi:hypothetical protein
MPGTTALALAAAVAVAVAVLILAGLHAAPTGLRPARDAISAYGIGAYRAWYRAMVVAIGIGGLLLTAALARAGGVPAGGLVLLGVYGAARLAIAAFPTDPAGAAPTATGRVHVLLAATGYLALAVAAPVVGGALAGQAGWRDAGGLRVLAVLVPAACAVLFAAAVLPPLRPWFGAAQRLVTVAGQAWLLVVAVRLATRGS